MQKLRTYQIYFSEKTKANCYNSDFNTPIFNETATHFFENAVISKLIAQGVHKESEYFGVWSHRHSAKHKRFNSATFESELDCDCISFFKDRNNKNAIRIGVPKIYRNFLILLGEIGYKELNPKSKTFILFNHFVLRSELYEEYVTEILNPAMHALQTSPSLHECRQPYKYSTSIVRYRENPRLREQIGHYNMFPFILEWLPAWWVTKRGLTIKQL